MFNNLINIKCFVVISVNSFAELPVSDSFVSFVLEKSDEIKNNNIKSSVDISLNDNSFLLNDNLFLLNNNSFIYLLLKVSCLISVLFNLLLISLLISFLILILFFGLFISILFIWLISLLIYELFI